jgi:hypothetical protein
MKEDGSGRQRVSDRSILNLRGVLADGKWAAAWVALPDQESSHGIALYPIGGGAPVTVCATCNITWGPGGNSIYMIFPDELNRTYVIPFHGSLPAAFADRGVKGAEDLKGIAGLRVIEQQDVAPGPDADTYAFTKTTVHRNIYRVPLP